MQHIMEIGGTPRFSTLFILGLGHSGSTLLGRMLGCHPEAVFAGELLRLEQALSRPQERCSCGSFVVECPVWQRRIELLPQAVKTDFRHWTWDLIEGLRKAENKLLLVDSSKSRVLRLQSKWKRSPAGYVLLVRDPRGALRSALQEKRDLPQLLSSSRKWMRRYERFSRRHSSVCLTMFYEDLVASTEAELQRLCGFLGLQYTPEMLYPNRQTFHLIRASHSPYLKGTDRMNLDERWRSELTPKQAQAISHHLGKLSIYREHYGLTSAGAVNVLRDWCASFFRKLQRRR